MTLHIVVIAYCRPHSVENSLVIKSSMPASAHSARTNGPPGSDL